MNRRYNIINNSLGWLCFLIAAVSYLLTIEPTASFWDCPEFIAQGFKLEVGHPPGNPIFMLAARFFITLAGGNAEVAAVAVNSMNALLSAGTILLLFWTITHLMRRLIVKDDSSDMSVARMITIFGSGLVGALAYAWSDTFWYSAVEGEVYAFSSFCTALVFWLILKWENRADAPHSDRYLVLIAYVIGVSIAVHLLNLICIPAIVLVFYYKKWSAPTAKGSILALLLSFVIVALILFGLVPGFIEVSQYFELFFVNTLGLGYNSGVLVYVVLAVASFIWSIRELYARKSASRIALSFVLAIIFSGIPFIGSSLLIPFVIVAGLIAWLYMCKKLPVRVLSLIILSVTVIFAGYSSYALLLIRSSANTPMNQNAPDNVFDLASYLNREQYGETPLLYGTTFNSDVLRLPDGSASATKRTGYAKAVKQNPDDPDRYVEVLTKTDYDYQPQLNMLFPRLYSRDHKSQYMKWGGFTEADMPTVAVSTTVSKSGQLGPESRRVRKPTFMQNLSYFVNYQLVHMYFRYFMWNFAGRQNDLQGNGEVNRGNWISGIPAIDNARLGDQSLLPPDQGRDNKGHNVFYMLPLLLGIVGLLWQSMRSDRGIQQFWVVFFLFFMTGVAIVLYLNQVPSQPRERDYAFAGSFYAFAIWIGIGVGALYEGLSRLMKKGDSVPAAIVASVLGLVVPVQMVSQTWDDHDRSGRYTTRDFGMNYLSSLDENAIIFTNGDNDTFPLWYAQEVEGYRTDVRVINLSYLTTAWYAAQQRMPSYDGAPVPMTATSQQLGNDRRQSGYVVQSDSLTEPALTFLDRYYSPDADRYGVGYPVVEGGTVYIPVDADQAVKAGRITADEALEAVDAIEIDLPAALVQKNHQTLITQSDALTLDILATDVADGWVRPVYIANTVPEDYYLGLRPYMYTTGMAREVLPLFNANGYKEAKTDKAYRNITERFRWGGLDAPDGADVYLDETVKRMVISTRNGIIEVVATLIGEEQYEKALEVLTLMDTKIPVDVLPYGMQMGDEVALYFLTLGEELGDDDARSRGIEILEREIRMTAPYLAYMASLTPRQIASLQPVDRAMMQYGDYSYINELMHRYLFAVGEEEGVRFFNSVSDECGVDIVNFFMRFNSRSRS